MPKVAKEIPVLTDLQVDLIRKNWKMDLRELVCLVFGDPTLTLRNQPQVKAVKKCLAELGLGGTTGVTVIPQRVELTPEIIQYVENNHENSTPLELLRTAFKDDSLTLLTAEGRAILALLKKIAPQLYNRDEEPVDELEYKPPKTLKETMNRVNQMVPNPAGLDTPLYQNPLNAQQEKSLNQLWASLNIIRFIHQASQYIKKIDRELFESSFMRLIHDNNDVNAADLDLYITYCSSVVKAAQLERTSQRLQAQVDEEFEQSGRTSESIVEHIKTLNDALQKEKTRQEHLYKTLNGERSKRINDLTQASISMHPLVAAWQTKKGRDLMLKGAKIKRDALGNEIVRLSGIDAIKAEILGIDPESILK